MWVVALNRSFFNVRQRRSGIVVHRNAEGRVVSVVALNACGIWKVQLHTFFSLGLGSEDWSGSRSSRLLPEETTVFTHRVQANLGLLTYLLTYSMEQSPS